MFMDLIRCPITQITGVKVIIDCSHLAMKTILTLRPWHVKFAAQYIQNSAPIRFKECHFLNHDVVLNVVWKLMKPVVSEKFVKRVHFHGNEVKSLRAYFPPSVLPEELGGDMGPWDNTEYVENLLKYENLLTENIRKFATKTKS